MSTARPSPNGWSTTSGRPSSFPAPTAEREKPRLLSGDAYSTASVASGIVVPLPASVAGS